MVTNALSLTLAAGISQAFMAISVLLTARELGSAEFGRYAASFSTTGLASIFFNLGLDNWLLQSGARDSDQLGNLLGSALVIKVLAGIPWIGAMAAILPRLNPDTFQVRLVFVSAASIWMEGLFTISLSALKALLRNRVTALLMIGSRSGTLLLTVLLIVANRQEAAAYAWARLAAAGVIMLVTVVFLPIRTCWGSVGWLRRAGQESLPFALSDLFTTIYAQADTTIASITLSRDAVGLYAPASSLINAIFVIPSALYFVMVPVLVHLIKAKRQSLNRVLGLTIVGFAALGGVLWIGTRYGSSILSAYILGGSFGKSGLLLAILSPITFLKSCSFAAVAILVAVGWQDRRLYVQAISAVTNVALNLAVVYRFGVTGIAWVYVVSESLLMLGYMGLVALWMQRYSRNAKVAI